ncbi:hypothetical protein [Streptomyces pseudovenezuelae]|uniref:hypothetical protein n=1 Tax=Streptomyces pseudovenezuelae TaxID=67350 RepID=UPI002E32BB9E|nr:hypothetical protein [Streptomyces pseudovenezuelae]
MRALSDVTLAAVWTPNPHHPYTWAMFLGFLLLVFGGAITVTGAYATVTLLRGPGERKWGSFVIGPFMLAVGLAIGYAGVALV